MKRERSRCMQALWTCSSLPRSSSPGPRLETTGPRVDRNEIASNTSAWRNVVAQFLGAARGLKPCWSWDVLVILSSSGLLGSRGDCNRNVFVCSSSSSSRARPRCLGKRRTGVHMTNTTMAIVQSMRVFLNRRSASPCRQQKQVSGHELVGNENGNLCRKRFLVLAQTHSR